MASTNKYSMLSDDKRDILIRMYNTGMTGAGAVYKDLIDKASKETGLSIYTVKVQISFIESGSIIAPCMCACAIVVFMHIMGASVGTGVS